MHFLLTALGSYGDVFPMIGLGSALAERGHELEVVANPYFADRLEAAGLTMLPIGEADDYVRLTQRRDLWSSTKGLRVVFREASVAVLEPLYELVRDRYRADDTIIAAHGLDLASRVLAETHGARVASIVYAPMALWSDTSPPLMPAGIAWDGAPRWLHQVQFRLGERVFLQGLVGPVLDAFRAAKGLGPAAGDYWSWYYGVAPPVCLFPDWFVSATGELPSDWPEGTVTTGFPLGDGDHPLPAEVERFLDAGDAPIAFTPGSAMRHGDAFFAAAVDACRRLGRRGVLLTKYPEQLPRRLPDTILAPGFTPLARLLERSAAFVHHGGIGSCARGLASGVPQLVQPMAFDQFDNARRLIRLGVAERIAARRFTGRQVAKKIAAVLTPTKQAAADRAKALVDPSQALAKACLALEARRDTGD
ncbi:glycosyltransferase [Botrimarina sp.]|uniref:glycosyltransferase n=1 Tax=Botrimarina sp. TaxID=2795802 RepID=UPI0032F04503